MPRYRLLFCVYFGLSIFSTLAGCGGAGGVGTQNALPISVSVSPGSVTLTAGGTQAFAATVANDSSNAGVTWSASTGTISSAGLYTAPTPVTTTSATVTATSKADPTKTSSATVTLTPISVSVGPNAATLIGGATQTFNATVTGDTVLNEGVSWTASTGSITSGGLYTAPAVITTLAATVTATSKTDPSKSAVANITLTPVSVTITPTSPASMMGGATQQFTATVANDGSNSGVTWTASVGSVNSHGLYTATSPVTTATATVTATSMKDPTKSATATIPLIPITITLTSANSISLIGDGVQTATIGASITGDGSASGATFVVSGAGGAMSASPVSGNSPSSLYTTPVVSAATSSVITVTSVADPTKTQTVAVTLNPPMSFTTPPGALAAGTTGATYAGATIGASGGTGTRTFSIAGGSLPAGLSMSASGVISGTPTGALGTSNFTVQVMDQSSSPNLITGSFSIVIEAPQLQSSSPSSIATGTAGTTITLTGTAFGPTTAVYFGSFAQPTTFLTNQSVSFVLPPESYTGSVTLYVRNGSYNSNTITIQIVNPVPTLTSISPTAVVAGLLQFSAHVERKQHRQRSHRNDQWDFLFAVQLEFNNGVPVRKCIPSSICRQSYRHAGESYSRRRQFRARATPGDQCGQSPAHVELRHRRYRYRSRPQSSLCLCQFRLSDQPQQHRGHRSAPRYCRDDANDGKPARATRGKR